MNDLLAQVIAAHGGLDRWNRFKTVTATVVAGGGLLPLKGLDDPPTPRERTVWLHEEVSSISPFGQSDWHMVFTPDRVVIETATGKVVSERSNPRAAFRGHVMETVWDLLHRAGKNLHASNQGYTYGFVMRFANAEVYHGYAPHPAHQPVSQELQSLCEKIIDFDLATND